MGRRRKSRKKISLKPKKRLPKVFTCPNCGATVVNVSVNKRLGRVRVLCSNCRLEAELDFSYGFLPVDYFSKFVDLYYQGMIKPRREAIISITKLTEDTDFEEKIE